MTKKAAISAVLVLVLLFALVGCGGSEPKADANGKEEPVSAVASEDWFEWNEDDYITSVCDEALTEKEIVVPARCKGICKGAFSACECETIRFESDADIDLEGLSLMAVPNLKTLILPKELTVLNEWVARNNNKLESITIPAHVTSIGEEGLCYNEALKEVIFAGNEITSIGDGAFAQDDALETIKLPEGLVSLGVDVFRDCESLKEIYLPASLASIDGDLLGVPTDGLTVHVKAGSWADQNRDVWDPVGGAEVVAD